ncbi:MAG TPA: hypothetical protein VF384_11730 [Planctomycetota bacterium]
MLLERLPRRSCRALCSFAFTASVALVAQDEVTRAIEDLTTPDRQPRSFAVLQAAGARCVPQLRKVLERAGTENEPRPEQLLGALHVLGCLGKDAVPALAEVQDVFVNTKHDEVRNQSMWAIYRLATASGDARVCASAANLIRRNTTARLDWNKYAFVVFRLDLGPEPTPSAVLQLLRSTGQPAAAAAAAAADMPKLDNDLVHALDEALDLAVARPSTPWQRNTKYDAAGGEIAAALWQHGHRETKVARGLLQHWDPRLRHLGLQQLMRPLHLTPEERLDVICCLWDSDRLVREQAVANLQSYGRHGLMALRALRAFERHPESRANAPVYQRAAVRLLRDASTGASDVAAAMLADADRILRGEPITAEATTSDEAGCSLLADIVLGCRGEQDGTLEALARLAVARKAFADRNDDGLLLAFVASLGTSDESAWLGAARALAALGPRVARRLPELTDLLLQSRTSFEDKPNTDLVFVVEAEILAGQTASVAELRAAQDTRRWHVVLHAIVEQMQRNAVTAQDAPRLRALLSTKFEAAVLTLGTKFVAATGARPVDVALTERSDAVRVAAALALAGLGETPWTDADVASAIAEAWSLESTEVPAAVAEAIKEGRLVALAQKVESKERSRLRWPRFP